jgi:hypothetical protein
MDMINIAVFAGLLLEKNLSITAKDVQDIISRDVSVAKVLPLSDISRVMNLLVYSSLLEVQSCGNGSEEVFTRFVPEGLKRQILKESKIRRNDRRTEDRFVESIVIPPAPSSVYGNSGGNVGGLGCNVSIGVQ